MNEQEIPDLTTVRGIGNSARYLFLICAIAFAAILVAREQPWLEFAPIKTKVIDYFLKKPV